MLAPGLHLEIMPSQLHTTWPIAHNDYKWVRTEFLFQSVTVCW